MLDDYQKREEERQRLKQEFKKDFQLRQEFMEDLRYAQAKANVTRELNKMEAQAQDDTDDWVAKLNSLTATNEAKAEMVRSKGKKAKNTTQIDPIDSELMRLMQLETELREGVIPLGNLSGLPDSMTLGATKTLADQEIALETENLKKSNVATNPDVAKKSLGDFEV